MGSHLLGADHPVDVHGQLEAAKAKHGLLKRLPKLEYGKRVSGFDADLILWEVTKYAKDVAEGMIGSEDLLERIPVPGVPEGTDWKGYEGWSARMVRRDIAAIPRLPTKIPRSCWKSPRMRA